MRRTLYIRSMDFCYRKCSISYKIVQFSYNMSGTIKLNFYSAGCNDEHECK